MPNAETSMTSWQRHKKESCKAHMGSPWNRSTAPAPASVGVTIQFCVPVVWLAPSLSVQRCLWRSRAKSSAVLPNNAYAQHTPTALLQHVSFWPALSPAKWCPSTCSFLHSISDRSSAHILVLSTKLAATCQPPLSRLQLRRCHLRIQKVWLRGPRTQWRASTL